MGISRYYKRTVRYIKKMIKWIPIIHRQLNYSRDYGEILLSEYLKDMRDFLESSDAYSRTANRDSQTIRTWLRLYKKVQNEDYIIEVIELAEKELGRVPCRNTSQTDDSPCRNRLEAKQYLTLYRVYLDKGYSKHEKAHNLLWNYYSQYSRTWWD